MLTELVLDNNAISIEFIRNLLNSIACTQEKLNILSLNACHINDNLVNDLSIFIQKCTSLKKLLLNYNFFSENSVV